MNVKFHKPKDAIWRNASGLEVPVKFVPPVDKKKEAMALTIFKAAVQAEAILGDLHQTMTEAFAEVRSAVLAEFEIKGKQRKQDKGSITWYNFDKSLKVQADVNEIIKWDASLMTEALSLLNEYLATEMTSTESMVKELVASAFAGSHGGPDTRKVFAILKYESKIRNKKFQKACELIKQAQGIDKTKLYMRVWEKDETGQYRNINLNFSSI